MLRYSIRFAWYDLWVGAYWDAKAKTLYVCPLPCIVLRFSWLPRTSLSTRLQLRVMDALHKIDDRLPGEERRKAFRDMADYAKALEENM
jgi:hypothetical protein